MENKLIVNINIEDKQILYFYSFHLQQQFNQHHYFELRFNHDQMGLPGLINLENSRDFVGKHSPRHLVIPIRPCRILLV